MAVPLASLLLRAETGLRHPLLSQLLQPLLPPGIVGFARGLVCVLLSRRDTFRELMACSMRPEGARRTSRDDCSPDPRRDVMVTPALGKLLDELAHLLGDVDTPPREARVVARMLRVAGTAGRDAVARLPPERRTFATGALILLGDLPVGAPRRFKP